MNAKTNENAQAIEDLNGLLKNEQSAIETYKQALSKLKEKSVAGIISGCQQSHISRANKLRKAITELGGSPEEHIGLGGQFAKLVMAGAQAIGDKAIVMALEADEGEWSADYEWRLVSMHGNHRTLIKEELSPEQQNTEQKLRELANAATKGLWPAVPETENV